MMETIVLSPAQTKIMVHNSTGAGKTIAVLTGALARKEKGQKILVFCRTISQITSFLREWNSLLQPTPVKSLETRKIPLILPYLGKMRLCRLLDKSSSVDIKIPPEAVSILCHMLPCNYHPNRNVEKPEGERFILPTNIKLSYNPSPEHFKKILFQIRKSQCPYYLQHSMLKASEIVVTTYAYLWEPLFSHMLQSLGIGIEDAILIFDEAHNLANTVKESITLKDIEFVQNELGNHPMLSSLKEAFGQLQLLTPSDLGEEFMWSDLESFLNLTNNEDDKSVFAFLSSEEVLRMKRFLRLRSSGYIVANSEVLTFIRVAPKEWLSRFQTANLQIYMSGTFRPLYLFAKMFGFDNKDTVLLDFTQSNPNNIFKSYLSYKGLTSKASKRTPALFTDMAKTIVTLSELSPRHVMVVCPSYVFQQGLLAPLKEFSPYELIVEEKQTKLVEIQRELDRKKTKVLILAISSGKFSEGIQLVHHGRSLLSLLIFAGLPFATPSDDQKFISRLLANVLENPSLALNFEQVVPLMQLITQALGRTVRSQKDKGALVLLDYRAELLRGLDREFTITKYTNLDLLKSELREFFKHYPTIEELSNHAKQ